MKLWRSCLVALFTFIATFARATTIDPLFWQQLAEGADFIGIVECTVAGGIVAKYCVVETWKGSPKPGDTVAIRIATTFYGPRYPVVLVGDRQLVTGYQAHAPGRIMSTTLGGPVPLWWRNIPADLSLPLFQGSVAIDKLRPKAPDHFPPFNEIGSERDTLAEVRSDFKRFLALPAEERALEILCALAQKYLTAINYGATPSPELATGIVDATDHERAAKLLVERWDGPTEHRLYVERVVRQATLSTRRLVEQFARSPKDETYTVKRGDTLAGITRRFRSGTNPYDVFIGNLASIPRFELLPVGAVLQLRWRQTLVNACGEPERYARVAKSATEARPPSPPSAETIALAADTFSQGKQDASGFWNAADLLIKHRPDPVVRWLCEWRAPKRGWRDNPEQGYALGSWAAVNVGENRVANLTALLDAKDELVRVAAGVYLAFEDETKGAAALRKLATLPGDPGAWAALALARRGDRSVLERAIEALEPRTVEPHGDDLVRDMLVARVCELLSNSASAARLPQPFSVSAYPMEGVETARQAREFVKKYPRLIIVDPWLPLLREQKID